LYYNLHIHYGNKQLFVFSDYYEGGYRGGGGGGGRGGGGGGGGGGGHYRERRSPSYYKNRSRYDRSRSRSYSPRKS